MDLWGAWNEYLGEYEPYDLGSTPYNDDYAVIMVQLVIKRKVVCGIILAIWPSQICCNKLNPLNHGRCKSVFQDSLYLLMYWALPVKLVLSERHKTALTMSQH